MNKIQIRTGGAVLVNGQPYSPGTLKVYFEDPVIKVFDTMGRQNMVLSASYDQILYVGTDGVGIPFESFDELKTVVVRDFFPDAPKPGGVPSSAITVSSYAEMIALATGRTAISFLVLEDESKNLPNTTYQYFPTPAPVLMWLASINENI